MSLAEDDQEASGVTYVWTDDGYCVMVAPTYDPPVAVDPSHCTIPGNGP